MVQLALGIYAPIRVHLRLWQTEAPFGGGTWTLGAAHFEVLIPGTADHGVLSWDLARDIVASDIARAGLVVAPPAVSDDYVYVEGSVTLNRTGTVDGTGRYEYQSGIVGTLTVTPMDVTQSPPVPAGPSFQANISELQNGFFGVGGEAAFMKSKRIAPQPGGAELWMEDLKCSSNGVQSYRLMTQCLAP